jgi:Ca-activated chloride channel family protein
LKKIAETTSGKYFRASDEKSFEDIFDTIAKLEKKEITSESFIMNTQKNIIFVYILLGLFVLLLYLIIRKKI